MKDTTGDATTALAGLAARMGATDFELGYLDDDKGIEGARWWAHITYRGHRIIVEDQTHPDTAADALAVKLLGPGAFCMKCRKPINLAPESRPVRRRSCVFHRVGATWVSGCDPDPAHNQPRPVRPGEKALTPAEAEAIRDEALR